jgi:hypothetical protein
VFHGTVVRAKSLANSISARAQPKREEHRWPTLGGVKTDYVRSLPLARL